MGQPQHSILIRGATVIDGTGRRPAPGQAVLVHGDRIAAIGPAASAAAGGAEMIEAAGLTLLPGLINMHAHLTHSGHPRRRHLPEEPDDVQVLRAARNALASLVSGVTTVRDVGCKGTLCQVVRDAVACGMLVGPRIVTSGRMITTSAGHGWRTGLRADTAGDLKKAVRTLVEEGADLIKVAASGGGGTPGSNVGAAQYTADELKVVVGEARRLGKRVAAHAIATDSIRNAVLAGIDTIEHCGWMDSDGRLTVDQDVVARMLAQGTTIVPTCTVWWRAAYDDFSDMSEDRKKMRAVREERARAWSAMHRAGIRFAAGPDTGIPDTYWDNFAWEVELFVEKVGLTPMEAIVAATRSAATALGLEDEIGTVELGKVADLLLVEGDPLTDIGALRRVNRVFRAGRPVVERGRLLVA